MLPRVRRKGGPEGGEGVLCPGEIHGEGLVPAAGQGDEFRLHRPGGGGEAEHPPLPCLVKAPALGTAWVGPVGIPLPVEAVEAVDMPQGQVVQAGGGDVLGGDGAVVPVTGHVAVETHEPQAAVLRRGQMKARQRGLGQMGAGEGPAVDRAALLRQVHGGDGLAGEDVDVGRPVHRSVDAARGAEVVVARGEEHGTGQLPQAPEQGLNRLRIDPLGIEQVAGQQDQVGPPVLGQLHQPVQQLPLLPPPLRRPGGGKAGKGAVQVEVGPVKNG